VDSRTATVSIDTAEAVRNHVQAFNRGDSDAVADGFTADALFTTGRDIVVRGRSELRQFFGDALDGHWLRLEITGLVVEGNRVAAQLREHILVRDTESVDHIAAFYVVDGGLLRSVKVYREGSATA
jgi:hypothetical protein